MRPHVAYLPESESAARLITTELSIHSSPQHLQNASVPDNTSSFFFFFTQPPPTRNAHTQMQTHAHTQPQYPPPLFLAFNSHDKWGKRKTIGGAGAVSGEATARFQSHSSGHVQAFCSKVNHLSAALRDSLVQTGCTKTNSSTDNQDNALIHQAN